MMIKTFKYVVMSAMFAMTTSYAQVPGVMPNKLTFKACISMGEAAEAAMKARQGGIPVTHVLQLTGGNKVLVAITMGAYDYPRYQTQENQERAAEEYRNTWETMCLHSLDGT